MFAPRQPPTHASCPSAAGSRGCTRLRRARRGGRRQRRATARRRRAVAPARHGASSGVPEARRSAVQARRSGGVHDDGARWCRRYRWGWRTVDGRRRLMRRGLCPGGELCCSEDQTRSSEAARRGRVQHGGGALDGSGIARVTRCLRDSPSQRREYATSSAPRPHQRHRGGDLRASGVASTGGLRCLRQLGPTWFYCDSSDQRLPLHVWRMPTTSPYPPGRKKSSISMPMMRQAVATVSWARGARLTVSPLSSTRSTGAPTVFGMFR